MNPIVILHLSDLHFGDHCRFAKEDPKELGKNLAQSVQDILKRKMPDNPPKVNLAAVTGDIAGTAHKNEYAIAVKFFEALSGGLGIARDRFVFTPGNHDVSWPACRIVENQHEMGELVGDYETILHSKKFDPFESHFIKAFFGKPWNELAKPLSQGAFIYEPDDMNLSIAALNSCEIECHKTQRGHIGDNQAQSLMDYWKREKDEQRIRIVMVHHNPFAAVENNVEDLIKKWKALTEAGKGPDEEWMSRFASEATGFEGKQFLEQICDQCKVALTLCGHQHAPKTETWTWNEGGQTRLLSAGSLGVKVDELPKDYSNNAKVLIISPQDGLLENCSLVYNPKAPADGSVKPGCFVPDNTHPDCQKINHLYIPKSAAPKPAPVAKASATAAEKELSAFYAEYRARLSPFKDIWELSALGGIETRGKDRKPVQCKLENMYQPIRIKADSDKSKNGGTPLTAEQILERILPLIVKGPAGCGKTTWIRHIFKNLLKLDGCLPVMVELRRLARVWNDLAAVCQERSIDSYLVAWISDNGLSGWKSEMSFAFKAEQGPRPVLLVDGWDELGELGSELRDKLLGFMKAHPRVLAVVTSRPYGKEPPGTSDSFEEMDIQALNKDEIQLFAGRFYKFCCGEDLNVCAEKTGDFMNRLANLPQATQLAKNPLLLTMLLFVNRTSPLPDKRHLLYEQCINNMLTTLPERRKEEGVQALREHWCPSDSEERFQITSKLALALQDTSKAENAYENSLIEAKREDLEIALPGEWPLDKKQGFILWLAEACGLLSDKADGTYSFSHLSFQEYLAARALEAGTTGDVDRQKKFKEKMSKAFWWETLRLWAAKVRGDSKERINGVLEALMEDNENGWFLCGSILADIAEEKDNFMKWLTNFPIGLNLQNLDSGKGYRLARTWQNSSNEIGRNELIRKISEIDSNCNWLESIWLNCFLSELESTYILPSNKVMVIPMIKTIFSAQTEEINEINIYLRRTLENCVPCWPLHPLILLLLRLWPCSRKIASLTIQNSVIICPNDNELYLNLWHKCIDKSEVSAEEKNININMIIKELLINSISKMPKFPLHNIFNTTLGIYLLSDLIQKFLLHMPVDDIVKSNNISIINIMIKLLSDFTSKFTIDFSNYLGGFFSIVSRSDAMLKYAQNYLSQLNIVNFTDQRIEFGLIEISSFGRIGPRAYIAHSKNLPKGELWKMFKEACHLSYHPSGNPEPFLKTVKKCNKDHEIWPALARHVARLSTPEDRALLVDYAMHPEKAEPPLSWGLKYMVRGDVMVSPGEVITLNELADQHGIPHLPYLEDMPDELDLGEDFEKIGK